jgi:hypothetical protein
MKVQRESRGIAVIYFNFDARWGWVVNATPRQFYRRERAGNLCIRGWMDHRAGMDGCGKSLPYRDSIPGPSCP